MADNEDLATKRESYYNQQRSSHRSSLRSDKSSNPPSRSRPHSRPQLDEPELRADRADSETLSSPVPSSPAPNVPYTRSRANSNTKRNGRSRTQSSLRGRGRTTPDSARRPDEILGPELVANPHVPSNPPPNSTSREHSRHTNKELSNNSPSRSSRAQWSRHSSFLLGRLDPRAASGSQLDITALPSLTDAAEPMDVAKSYSRSKPSPSAQRASRVATELYTISYLIFFAIWGTLARLSLQALTFYPGAPLVFSELWANVAGTFIVGFLSEDRRLFRAEWGNKGDRVPEPADRPAERDEPGAREEKARHGKVKKTIPMYIGLATGFCGSFTSFSSFVRDVFLALSNDLRSPINHPYPSAVPIPPVSTTVSRDGGYSFMAICATIIITLSTCYSALKLGAHFALLLDTLGLTPTLPFRFTRRIIDPLIVFLGWGIWLGAIIMVLLPPHNAWRGQALFACVFAPVGCLLRYYVSLYFNPLIPSFPMGTFAVNIFGTAVLGMAYDLQHVSLRGTGVVGGSVIGCQVLQGIMDGFCGAMTTVSTWIVELDALKRRHAYVYGAVSVVAGLSLLVAIMGSVRWTVGWQEIICTI